ncbi:DUF4157 domain-containing protein [Streptomyces sp. NPDC014724]|uniref:eCIS core domain-containing protein n=1 Tax=unclassified Streptomyces TaxID=2593676 RepID=UPI0036FB4699
MSTSRIQDSQTDQAAEQRRRKRRERAAKSRAPEPKDMVSGAGQPLDIGVRRELEEQLGHDFSRVRLHTDRDSGALTELLGADAVAVGQDIFFGEGAYLPGTAEGQRLLAHELLHTVQNPHGLGALRAGRDLGAVSLPQQAIEREAESAAQDLVRPSAGETMRVAPEVNEGQATPGWLRYATLDADRNRMERIDPATLVDRLTNSVVRSLRGDPEDLSKRTRKQLARLPAELLDGVLEHLEDRLLGSEHDRILDLVDEIEGTDEPGTGDGLELNSHDAPADEPDAAQELESERANQRRSAEERLEDSQRPGAAPGPEKDDVLAEGAPGSTPQNGGAARRGDGDTAGNGSTPQGDRPDRKPGAGAADGNGGSPIAGEQQSAPSASAPGQETSTSSEGSSGSGSPASGTQQGAGTKDAGSESGTQGREGTEQHGAPAASKEESAARNRPGAVDSLVTGRQLKPEDKRGSQQPEGSATPSGKDTRLPSASSTLDGVRNQDLDGPQDEAPFDTGGESEVDIGGGEQSAWDVKLQAEDFLPAQDLDVSGVPTADRLDPSSAASPAAPSFPAPPVTKADQVQAERDAEDAEDAAADAGPEEEGVDAASGPEPMAEADDGAPGDGQAGGLALERASDAPTTAGTASRDPESGDDPKAGPVAAQMTVQEAPASSATAGGDAKEGAAKEEKGTPVAGDRSGGAQEKGSPQAVAGRSAASGTAAGAEQSKPGAAPTASDPGRAGADTQSASPARDTPVSGGSDADTPGRAIKGAESGERGGTSDSGAAQRSGHRTPAARQSTPASSPPRSPETPAVPTQKGAKASKAAPAPTASPAAKGPRGAGSGGGTGAVPAPAKGKKDSGPTPNLSTVSPEAGLSTASQLKPHKALQAMSGVGGAVDRTVGDEHKALAAAPPSMTRPAGARQTLRGKPKADAPAQYSQDPAQKSDAPEQEKAEVEGAKEPEGQIEAEKAEEPGGWDTFKMALGFGLGKVASWLGFKVDAQELAAKFAGLPTKDEALKKAQAGNAPGVQMQGAAEQTAGEQGSAVDAKGQEAVATGREDAGRPMGENQVYPDVPKEQMRAEVPGAQGGASGAPEAGAGIGAVPPEAASEVAEHERGPQFRAAFGAGRKAMSDGRQTKDRDFRDSQQKHKQKVDAEVGTNTRSQAAERDKAMAEVTSQRADWRTEQDGELKKLGTKKTERHEKVREDVKDKEEKTDKDVTKEKEDGDKKIQDENTKAEKDAEEQRDTSVKDSGNWVSKAFDWIKQKVIEIKNAIVRVIRAAREAVVGFIKHFKETVERWINEARKFIVDTIKNLINDLIELAKNMVRAVIELANRIRKLITTLIAAAIALVNRLAAALKQIVTDLLNAIGKVLSDILNVLKKMLQAAVKAVVDAVKAVLDFASKLLSALGDWMLIAVDFLSDPGGWLSGAKNSAVDGAKNHLFREVSSAVKQWFKDKIQEIIGVPKAILDKLVSGGFTLEKIVKEAWDAVVPQLPLIIGELVMTKVVAKLIPGAGWVMAVIDAIRTAWGALSAILRALSMVLDWLKLVRSGGAGLLFAKAVASGVVALLEVLYQALLNGIGKYVSKVGKRLKGVAAKLGKRKGDKGGGKGPGDAGSDDKGGKGGDRKDGQSPNAPKSTAAPASRPPTTRPRSDTDKGANPKRPTGEDKTPGTRGKPKDRPTEKRDTRPTPPARPKPTPEPRPKPKQDPGTARPRSKDDPSARPKDEKDTPGRPKGDGKGPNRADRAYRAEDKSPNKLKTDDKDSLGRPKDSDKPGKPKGRDDKDKGDSKKPKEKHENKQPNKPKRPKHENGRAKDRDPDKAKQEKKDERKKKEDSKDSKDARLQKVLTRIRPRIHGMLGHGIEGVPFRASLATMRIWYRLTSLSAKSEQGVTDIWAVLNPGGSAGSAYHPNDSELREIIRDAVDRFFRDNRIQSSAQRLGKEEGTYARNPGVPPENLQDLPHVAGGADVPAAVEHMLRRGSNVPRDRMGYTLGSAHNNDDNVLIVEYHQGAEEGRTNDRNAFVNGITSYPMIADATEKAHARLSRQSERLEKRLHKQSELNPETSSLDPEIVQELRAMRLGDATVAQIMHTFMRTGKWPTAIKLNARDKNRMARLIWLMYVRESVRDRENVALAPMTIDLIQRGEMTWEEAFKIYEPSSPEVAPGRPGGRGTYPASMRNASRATRGLEAQDRGVTLWSTADEERIRRDAVRGTIGPLNDSIREHGTQEERDELQRRKVELVGRWLEVRMKASGGTWGTSRDDVVEFIHQFLLSHHGMTD